MSSQPARCFCSLSCRGGLACFVLGYFLGYYLARTPWLDSLYTLLGLPLLCGLALCCLRKIAAHSSKSQQAQPLFQWLFSLLLAGSLLLLGAVCGAQLRQRTPLAPASLGMPPKQVRIFLARVLQDARLQQSRGFLGQRLRFAVRVLASSDGRWQVSSAAATVWVSAARANPAPALGQLVLVQAEVAEFADGGGRMLYSRVAKDSLQLLTALPQSPVLQQADETGQSGLGGSFASSQLALLATAFPLYFPLRPGASSASRRTGYQSSWPSVRAAAAPPPRWRRELGLRWLLWRQGLWRLRRHLRKALLQNLQALLPLRGRNLFLALLLGVSDDLPQGVRDNFRLAGSAHILALSGFHVGVLAGIASVLLRPLLGLRRSLLVSAGLLLGYVWLVGPLPSLVRAVLMLLLLQGCQFCLRRGNLFWVWGLSALVQTQLFPAAALRLSFQLSYAALLGLILFAGRSASAVQQLRNRLLLQAAAWWPLLRMISSALGKGLGVLAQGVAVTLAVLLPSAPILIANFGQIYWIGVVASLVETPIIVVYLWLSLLLWPLANLLAALGLEAAIRVLGQLYSQLYHWSIAPVEFFARASPWVLQLPSGVWRVGHLVIYFFLSGLVLAFLYRYELLCALRGVRLRGLFTGR